MLIRDKYRYFLLYEVQESGRLHLTNRLDKECYLLINHDTRNRMIKNRHSKLNRLDGTTLEHALSLME